MENDREITIPRDHLPAKIISIRVRPNQPLHKDDTVCIYEFQKLRQPSYEDDEDEFADNSDNLDPLIGKTTSAIKNMGINKKRKTGGGIYVREKAILVCPFEGDVKEIVAQPGDSIRSEK